MCWLKHASMEYQPYYYEAFGWDLYEMASVPLPCTPIHFVLSFAYQILCGLGIYFWSCLALANEPCPTTYRCESIHALAFRHHIVWPLFFKFHKIWSTVCVSLSVFGRLHLRHHRHPAPKNFCWAFITVDLNTFLVIHTPWPPNTCIQIYVYLLNTI